MGCIDIADIVVGERDRIEMGEIAALAESIDEVGLLHPVVVTADHVLVAGGRRLAACVHLGWLEVPVTVVDLESAPDVLRAELEENTCRKPLTPYEAARARERRAVVLAPKAAENRGGRPAKDAPETSTKLVPVSARKTKNVAALGTGYSGSTLDKVDRLRDVAERGVVRRGRREVPTPEPVRQVAREALEGVKQTGAAVDAADKKLAAAMGRYMEADPEVKRLRRSKEWRAAFSQSTALYSWDLEEVMQVMDADEWIEIQIAAERAARWYAALLERRPGNGLRVVGGSK